MEEAYVLAASQSTSGYLFYIRHEKSGNGLLVCKDVAAGQKYNHLLYKVGVVFPKRNNFKGCISIRSDTEY